MLHSMDKKEQLKKKKRIKRLHPQFKRTDAVNQFGLFLAQKISTTEF